MTTETIAVPVITGGLLDVEVDVTAHTATCKVAGETALSLHRGKDLTVHGDSLVHIAAACAALLRVKTRQLNSDLAPAFQWLEQVSP